MAETRIARGDMQASASTPPNGPPAFPIWLKGIVVLGALLLITGAAIALLHPVMLVSPHDEINDAVRIYAGYFASRNLGLAFALLVAMGLRAKETLNGLLLFAAITQFIDALMDVMEHRLAVAPGVVVLGLIFCFAAARLSGQLIWRTGAWRGTR